MQTHGEHANSTQKGTLFFEYSNLDLSKVSL